MSLLRITGIYVGFEELKKEMSPLIGPTPLMESISQKMHDVEQAARKDNCDLHYLIQENVKIYRVAVKEGNVALSTLISNILSHMGVEITEEGWGFKGEHPAPLNISAKVVLFR